MANVLLGAYLLSSPFLVRRWFLLDILLYSILLEGYLAEPITREQVSNIGNEFQPKQKSADVYLYRSK